MLSSMLGSGIFTVSNCLEIAVSFWIVDRYSLLDEAPIHRHFSDENNGLRIPAASVLLPE